MKAEPPIQNLNEKNPSLSPKANLSPRPKESGTSTFTGKPQLDMTKFSAKHVFSARKILEKKTHIAPFDQEGNSSFEKSFIDDSRSMESGSGSWEEKSHTVTSEDICTENVYVR